MVTGDHKLTAAAVARELGLLDSDGTGQRRVLEGRELERMTEEELAAIVEDVAVYARVSPEHKMKIVGAWKRRGHVVAMTGDGVNDAPALKLADIGVAMGITGTDVTKEASDMVLMDDNFATIVAAVEEGRIIYDNIKKYLVYLLSANVGEIFVLGFAGLVGLPLPLLALQILWVNLTTDGLPALALGVEPPEPNLMRRPPRAADEPVFTTAMYVAISGMGLIMFFGLLPVFYVYWQAEGVAKGQTMVLVSMILFELLRAFSCRSMQFTIVQLGFFTNRWLVLANLSSALLDGRGDLHSFMGNRVPYGLDWAERLGRCFGGGWGRIRRRGRGEVAGGETAPGTGEAACAETLTGGSVSAQSAPGCAPTGRDASDLATEFRHA